MSRSVRLVLLAASVTYGLVSTARAAGRPSTLAETAAPDPASIERYGPAYRYPQAGWVVLHIEGEPYERGYQHGRLLAPEIADYIKTVALKRSVKAPADSWRDLRTLVNALFLRRYDKEFLEEMKGTADGAAAAGAKYNGRAVDLIDVVALNSEIEVEFLDAALHATATGLEGGRFATPDDDDRPPKPPEHCSAFAATGPATADGAIVFGHITMYSLPFVRHFNVWLDVKPARGHRVAMQTFAGGIQSGMDYYMNDAGLLVAETTITQTKFDSAGEALASRIRKALQYSESIDQVVAVLLTANSGMYTNEWLLADTKTNEIAMFELGTSKSKLWRSGNDEWVGGTKGFYWGCNNTKDLEVRLETVPSLAGKPANVVFRPHDRDLTWVHLYQKHKGKIGEDFGFEAFTTPPIAGFPSCDAKFTTSALAKDLKTRALFGPPLGRTWDPTEAERIHNPAIQPLIRNDWTTLSGGPLAPPESDPKRDGGPIAVDLGTTSKTRGPDVTETALDVTETALDSTETRLKLDQVLPAAWRGTLVPKTAADVWLAAAFSDYEKIVALERALHDKAKDHTPTAADRDRIDLALFAPHTHYRTAVAREREDTPLSRIEADWESDDWYDIASGKGVLLLADLRARLGDADFLKLMDDFGRAHAGTEVTTAQFLKAVDSLPTRPLPPRYFDGWLNGKGLPSSRFDGVWSIDSFEDELDKTLIVYGTLKESHAQREAAERLQRQIARRWSNETVPIVSDTDAGKEDLANRHLLIVGRPDSNALAQRFAQALPIRFGPASFEVRGKTYAHPASAVIAAGPNPLNPHCELVIHAGLGAEATWRCVLQIGDHESPPAEVVLLPAHGKPRRLAITGTVPEEVKVKAAAAD